MPVETSYLVGLDLGQTQDFTALVALEKSRDVEEFHDGVKVVQEAGMGTVITLLADPAPPKAKVALKPSTYHCRLIERFDLGTPYTTIVDRVTAMFERAPREKHSTLVIDGTGVGRPVVDMFARARPRCHVVPVTIAPSAQMFSIDEWGYYRVPKKDLVGALQILFQNDRLKIVPSLPHAATLVKELDNFRVKITAAGNETFEAWREKAHDDIVLAVALAAWMGEKGTKTYWMR